MTLVLTIALLAAQAASSYAGKPLGDVLRDLQRRGLNIVFSSELVKPDMKVEAEPKTTTPRRILDEVLAPHGLAVRGGPRDSLVVVRGKRAPEAATEPRAAPAGSSEVERIVSGVVVRADRAPIEGAIVSSSGKTAITNNDGRFILRLPAGRAAVNVSAPAFYALAMTLDVTERDITDAEFALASQTGFASNVEVVGGLPTSSPSATTVAPRDVLKTPGAVDNVFRTLQTLPGVAAVQEFSSRMTVRGGAPDQNLTVMDGVEVHDPFRLFGIAAAFNPEIIQRFELATSGFSAKYGDRLSSLLLIENRDGNRSRGFRTSGSLSITDANVVFEGKLPRGVSGSWLVTGRRTYYDLIAARIVDSHFPQFADLQAKAVWEPAAGRKLTFFGLRSRQSAAVDDDRPEDDERVQVNDDTRNDLAWVRLDAPAGARGHSTTVVGHSRTLADFDFDGRLDTSFSQRSNAPFQLDKPKTEVDFARRLAVSDLSLRQELAWSLGAHTVDAGGELHRLRTRLTFAQRGDTNPQAINGSSAQGGAGLPAFIDSRLNSIRAGAWVIDSWRVGARARIETGLRLDRTSVNAETALSPRLAVSIGATSRLSARASFGRFTQSPGYEKTAQSDYLLNLTADTGGSLRSERADLASFSLEQALGAGVTIRAETYYKRLTHLLIGRLETESERLSRLAAYDFPEALASSLPIDPIITTVPTNDGRGRSYGIDILLSRMTAPLNTRMRGWISYTWGKAELDAYGRTYPFEYDRRHAVSAVVSYRAFTNWELASTIRWATGFPWTSPVRARVAGEKRTAATGTVIEPKVDLGFLVYEVDFGGVANLNNARLPNFARVDVRASWRPRGARGRWEYYVEVINVLNRENASAMSAQLAYDPTSDRPRIFEERSGGLTLVPTLGVRWKF